MSATLLMTLLAWLGGISASLLFLCVYTFRLYHVAVLMAVVTLVLGLLTLYLIFGSGGL